MTFVIFHDFPGLENGIPKFHDQGAPWILKLVTMQVMFTGTFIKCYTTLFGMVTLDSDTVK